MEGKQKCAHSTLNRRFAAPSPRGRECREAAGEGRMVTPSEHVLQSKLHDPRIQCGFNLAEGIAVQDPIRIVQARGIRNVERLHAKFELLSFPDLECSRKRRIKLPGSRAPDAVGCHIAQRTQSWECECRRIQIVLCCFVPIRIAQHLGDPLSGPTLESCDTLVHR